MSSINLQEQHQHDSDLEAQAVRDLDAMEKQVFSLWLAIYCGNTIEEQRLGRILTMSKITHPRNSHIHYQRFKALLCLITLINLIRPVIPTFINSCADSNGSGGDGLHDTHPHDLMPSPSPAPTRSSKPSLRM